MTERVPLTDEQMRLNAAALHVYPDLMHPEDDEMEEVCESLVDRGSLVAIHEGTFDERAPGSDPVVGYQASEQLRSAMLMRSAMN